MLGGVLLVVMCRGQLFIDDLSPAYYVSYNSSALLTCSSQRGDGLLLSCHSTVSDVTCSWREGISLCRVEVTFIDVLLFLGDFHCRCKVETAGGVVFGTEATILPAYINDDIKLDSAILNVTEDIRVIKLSCPGPTGDPPPRIYWKENNREMRRKTVKLSNNSILLYMDHTSKPANYSCVASNVAGSVESNKVSITPPSKVTVHGRRGGIFNYRNMAMIAAVLIFGMSLALYFLFKCYNFRHNSLLEKYQSGTICDSDSWHYYPSWVGHSLAVSGKPPADPYVVDFDSGYLDDICKIKDSV